MTVWNSMTGSGILTLPFTFYQAGIIGGIMISLVSFAVSLRTCLLVVQITEPTGDYFDSMRKYWGAFGYYLALITFLAIVLAACIAQFLIMCQMIYPNLLALLFWIGKLDLPLVTEFSLATFSQTYVAILMYIFMLFVCLKRDMTIFICLSSYGALSIVAISLFIIGMGIYGFTNTSYVA